VGGCRLYALLALVEADGASESCTGTWRVWCSFPSVARPVFEAAVRIVILLSVPHAGWLRTASNELRASGERGLNLVRVCLIFSVEAPSVN
jgi:hypothetical protein